MTNETTQLARCPFCGGEAECIEFDGYRPSSPKTYRVSCNDEDCTMQSAEYRTEEDAITAWNTRAESAELAALRQRVQELDEIRDAIGLCAAAVVLAYYRKTHDHILVDNDAIDAALKVEHWLGRR